MLASRAIMLGGSYGDDDFQPLCWKARDVVKPQQQAVTGKRPSKRYRAEQGRVAGSKRPQVRPIESQVGFSGKNPGNGNVDSVEQEEGLALGTQMDVLLSLCRNAAETEKLDVDGDDDILSVMTQDAKSSEDVAEEKEDVDDSIADVVLENIMDCKTDSSDVFCPVCNVEISSMSIKEREDHSNECLDKLLEQPKAAASGAVNDAPVVQFLEKLNLSKYIPLFIKEEIDLDTLQCLTEQDLCDLGIEAFGPRKKIVTAIRSLKRTAVSSEDCKDGPENKNEVPTEPKKLITDFFGLPSSTGVPKPAKGKKTSGGLSRSTKPKMLATSKTTEAHEWMLIPGTKFRVDAFKHLTKDCSHWFLTHFHSDHYQGLTKGFRYGKIYCSSITAKLVHLRIGVPWDRLHPLNFDERTNIDGVWVTLLDANHCPGAAMILFETADGNTVLHTGDFRFSDEMSRITALLPRRLDTLILDTTYCNPQYDFPKQETVVQFVIDAIEAESFNPNTLFLIGSYSIGKERLFLEIGRVLQKKIYVGALKRKMLGCLDLSAEDMKWITTDDWETNVHVVPLWSIACFKRMASISAHYQGKYNTVVSFSPTGWSFGRGKKAIGQRWQQGTIVRYDVPYSEHSSFTELRQFVKLVAPRNIIPSVNNFSHYAAEAMIACLTQ